MSFAVNDYLMARTDGHHQILSFIPQNVLPALYTSHLQFLLVYGSFCLHLVCKKHSQPGWNIYPIKNILFLGFLSWYVWGHYLLCCEAQSYCFATIWLNLIRNYSSVQLIVLLPLAVTLLVNLFYRQAHAHVHQV